MDYSKYKFYELQIFNIGQLAKAITDCLEMFSIAPEKVRFSISSNLSETGHMRRDTTLSELKNVCRFDQETNSISLHFQDSDYYSNQIVLTNFRGFLQISVSVKYGEYLNKVFETFEHDLNLQTVEEKEVLKSRDYAKEMDEIAARLAMVEEMLLSNDEKLRCFISYRFNEEANKVVHELKSFLELVGIDVVTGSDYEPRKISDKVTDKLDDSLDFVIYLITQHGESFWTRDEIATGYGKNCITIPIIERGTRFEKGIFGDLEYIEFEAGHIGDSFTKLLQGIRFIKNNKK